MRSQKHSLVADRFGGHCYDIEVSRNLAEVFLNQPLGSLAGEVKFAFQLIATQPATINKNLSDVRLGRQGQFTETTVVSGHVSPSDYF